MINCYQISNLLFIFFGSVSIGAILNLLMMEFKKKIPIQEKTDEKAIRELEELDKQQKTYVIKIN